MIKILFASLVLLYTNACFAGYGGNIGKLDDRKYGSLSDPTYYGIVRLSGDRGVCTGGFVYKNLVITNSHCAAACVQGCTVSYWNGAKYDTAKADVFAYYPNYQTLGGNDWAILKTDKENSLYRRVSQSTPIPSAVYRGGFGVLRIIEDNEIPYLKRTLSEVYSANKIKCKQDVECINRAFDDRLKKEGKKPLLQDTQNFKVQNCNIISTMRNYPRMVKTSCDSAGGDSGAPLLHNAEIVGLNNSGSQKIFSEDELNGANALKTENFYNYIQQFIKQHQNNGVNTAIPNNNTQIQNNNIQVIQDLLSGFDCD